MILDEGAMIILPILQMWTLRHIASKGQSQDLNPGNLIPEFVLLIYLFIWLHTQDLQTLLLHMGSSSLTRDRTHPPCIGSTESWPLDHQGSPEFVLLTATSHAIRFLYFNWRIIALQNCVGFWQTSGFPCGSACNARGLVWSLGWEDPLEKGKATHSSIPAWRIPWTV